MACVAQLLAFQAAAYHVPWLSTFAQVHAGLTHTCSPAVSSSSHTRTSQATRMVASIGARRATVRMLQAAAASLLLLMISGTACAAIMLPSPRQLGQGLAIVPRRPQGTNEANSRAQDAADGVHVTPGASSPSSDAGSQGLLGQLWSALFAANKGPGADDGARVADGRGRVSGWCAPACHAP